MSSNATPSTQPTLTDQQQRALTARGVSVALSAGAGCGKTFVLTERFLRELEPEGAREEGRRSRLGQLVAITFTERAAREMRDRIRKACRLRLQHCPEEQAGYWLELIRDLDSARISTIHSFCASLLRSHAVEAGVDPRFRVLDGAQAATLLFELTDDLLRERLAERDEATLTLVTRFGLDKLRSMIARLLNMREKIDWPAWRDETPDGLAARWEAFWRSDTVPRVLQQIGELAEVRTLLDISQNHPPAPAKMRERCAVLMELLPKLYCGAGVPQSIPTRSASEGTVDSASSDPRLRFGLVSSPPAKCISDKAGETPAPQSSPDLRELLAAIREAAKVQGGATKKSWGDEDAYETFSKAAKALRDAIDDVKPQMQFDVNAARPAAALALQVLTLAGDLTEHYDCEKQELGVFDFNDLLIRARNLLVKVDAASALLRKRLASQIRLLLVDEFQDTDPLQVELVKALCDNEHLRGKLFLVGDHKQSIYRFRGADPSVFRQLRQEIPDEGRLPLSLNFRSQPAILAFVNALFAEELGPDYEPLRASRPQVSPTPAVEFLWACDVPSDTNPKRERGDETSPSLALRVGMDGDDADTPTRERLRRREADWIARRIRNMLNSGDKIIWDEKAPKDSPAVRVAKPGDFALLFRALTNVEYYEEALRRHGIDYYLVGGHAFYAQQEIYDVLNLLRTLDSPADDVSLAGVLRSPMFALNDETLFWLFQNREELGGALPEEIDGQQRRQAEFALATIGELRAVKDRVPVARLIQEALDRTGYDAMLLAEFLGERKLANLHKLVEQARSFDNAGIFTLSDFITQLSEFVSRQPDEALAATHAENTNVVKLMSIHQSKGLEFPVVIVPDLDRPRRVQGPPIAFSPELGPSLKDPDATTGYELLMARENREEMAELGRLLYVATTRAADYLILSAGIEDLAKPRGPWMQMLARRFELRGEGRGAGDEGEAVVSGQWSVASDGVSASKSPNLQISKSPNPSPLAPVCVTTTEPVVQSKPLDSRRGRNVEKIIEKASQMAGDGQGRRPAYLAPVPFDVSARRQYSFSRLSGKLHAEPMEPDKDSLDGFGEGDSPLFAETKLATVAGETASPEPIDALGLGTLVHAVLEEIDFARPNVVGTRSVPATIDDLVRRLAPQHLSSPNHAEEESLAIELIDRFLASPRAAKLAAATEIHRELEFMLAWPPGETAHGGRYLQGFIDCLYRDADGRWRLLDYKTNRVTDETLAATAAHYEMQMLVYAMAVETILGCPPAEMTLCFLRPGLEYNFSWDDAARQRVVELVECSIRQ